MYLSAEAGKVWAPQQGPRVGGEEVEVAARWGWKGRGLLAGTRAGAEETGVAVP